ncbi:toprim domain-containing protein [Calothrix sp. FACHB-1219]|uniref:toprim domain-containing protein n=1 Tax=unclassified Calothrix TaxID=2619626 RepID=UPI0016877B27|nr:MULTISPECIES: toprim domain-containing protein [unclassified Calothrix]MBD2201789.1 toprim domain-containing protein [Calothrix sp. FACHB-168]MBD2217475.1 toprim domain-containing protein [Calothrix sp. FACHB-1219]
MLDRVSIIKSQVIITDVLPGYSIGYNKCPSCGGYGKFSINKDLARCFNTSCDLNKAKDVIDVYRWVNKVDNFTQALSEIEATFGITIARHNSKRLDLFDKCADIYSWYLWGNKGNAARDYLFSRGFSEATLKSYKIGYAPHNNSLRDFDLDTKELIKEGLLNDRGEYYSNRIIFPIRNTSDRVVHFTGRYLGNIPNEFVPRYKDSLTNKAYGGTKDYLVLEETLGNISDSLIVAEGYPDTLSLKQKGINAVGLLGLEKLSKHQHKIKNIREIVFAFDNDKYPISHPKYPGEYKSWVAIIPQLIDLQLYMPESRFYIWMVDEEKGKDINDWLSKYSLDRDEVLEDIKKRRVDLLEFLIERYGNDFTYHRHLLKLVEVTKRKRSQLMKLIPPEMNPIDYAMQVIWGAA